MFYYSDIVFYSSDFIRKTPQQAFAPASDLNITIFYQQNFSITYVFVYIKRFLDRKAQDVVLSSIYAHTLYSEHRTGTIWEYCLVYFDGVFPEVPIK